MIVLYDLLTLFIFSDKKRYNKDKYDIHFITIWMSIKLYFHFLIINYKVS